MKVGAELMTVLIRAADPVYIGRDAVAQVEDVPERPN
jgi:hypothetical protein